jgi:hypothetical protein
MYLCHKSANLVEQKKANRDAHEGILQAHHANDKYIHAEREANNPHVEPDESVIFHHCQS